jgi:hypothetical protein
LVFHEGVDDVEAGLKLLHAVEADVLRKAIIEGDGSFGHEAEALCVAVQVAVSVENGDEIGRRFGTESAEGVDVDWFNGVCGLLDFKLFV